MKKLPKDYLLRQERIEYDRLKRKEKKEEKKKRRPRHRDHRPVGISGYEIIGAPEYLALTPEQSDEIILFARELERKSVAGKKMVIDFSKTKLVHALGAVYLYSEIDRAIMKASVIRIQGISKKQVRDALRITGILTLCGYPAPPAGFHIPVIRGKDDDHLHEIVEYLMNTALIQEELNTTDPDYAERLVNKAVSEAMLNVKQHAYPESGPSDFWWATAAILDSNLHIALCDRGVGIPKTLAEKGKFKAILAALKPGSGDDEMIKAAMEYTRSSRRIRGGGLGSLDIQQLVLDAHEGHLTIISGKGYYQLQGKNNDQMAKKIGYDVTGTLIQWQIPLHHQSEVHHEKAHN